jgi:ubiquitin C-terminal hydrolase
MNENSQKCDKCMMVKPSIEIIDCDNCFMNQCVDCLSKMTDYTKCIFCNLSTFKSSSLQTNDVDQDQSESDDEFDFNKRNFIIEDDDKQETSPYINNDPYIQNPFFSFMNRNQFFQSYQNEDPITKLTEATEKVSLQNQSNSCYVNCIIQIFLHSSKLWSRFITLKRQESFLLDIRKQYCDFAGISTFEQCDATLFLNWILDKLEKEKEAWSQKWTIMRKCLKCDHKTITNHEQNLWYVYPHENDESFVDEDGQKYDCDMADCIFNQDQDYIDKKCDECKVTTKHKQVSSLQNFPENLFFNFQHFEEKLVYTYQDIDLTVYPIDANIEQQTKNYILNGLVCHKGTQDFGHYTIYLKDSDGWYHYDDSRRTPINNIEEILSNKQRFRTIPLLWYTLEE